MHPRPTVLTTMLTTPRAADHPEQKELFKMSKFTKHAKPVVTKYMRQPAPAAPPQTEMKEAQLEAENVSPPAEVLAAA